MYDFNAGKIVSATHVVKLQSSSSLCVHLSQEFGICFGVERELLLVVIYKGEVGWEGVPGGAVCPCARPFAAAMQLPHPSSLRWRAKKQDTEELWKAHALAGQREAEWRLRKRSRSCPGSAAVTSGTGPFPWAWDQPLPPPPLSFLGQLWHRCYRIKSNPRCILSVFTSGTLWSVYSIFYLCFFVCYMS